ncbi:MAG: GGDEF domain-containing protein, partial [Oscillospiraceae bacterium]
MKRNALVCTNIIVCIIITCGFVATSIIGYRSNTDIFERDAEHVSSLAADGIYDQIDKLLSGPLNVSLAMANDNLLKSLLADEGLHLEDEDYILKLGNYLDAYREKYAYDSVFLVSTKTSRYYHFKGLDRVLTPTEPEDAWYYAFIAN